MSGCACKKLAQRREELVAQSIRQREQLVEQVQVVRVSVTPSQIGANLLATLSQNKLLFVGAALAVFVIKPRRIVSALKTGLVGWQMWHRVVPLVQHFLKRS